MSKDEIRCYGDARPTDTHLLAEIHCMNEEIYAWLDQHERAVPVRRRKRDALIALAVIALITLSVIAFALH